jgi:hypothetical protein
MSGTDKGILMYDTSLNSEVRGRIKEIGTADVVIGVPSHRNGRTIAEVVRAISDGVASYLGQNSRIVLMNADGGSSDNTSRHVSEASVPANVEKVVTLYEGTSGKGMGIRAILEATVELNAQACLVVEARAPGITPAWIPALISPVLAGNDLAVSCYQRSSHAAALTDNLVYPFLYMFFNTDFREPLPSEFCVSASMARELASQDVWETDVARFGFGIWLAMYSLAEGKQITQVDLGHHGDPSGDPGMPMDARFLQSVGTMFWLSGIYRKLWQPSADIRRVPFYGKRQPDRLVPCRECETPLGEAFLAGVEQYAEEWARILSDQTYEALMSLGDTFARNPGDAEFPVELWARIVIEFAVLHNNGEGDPDKVVEALLPIFYGRAAGYVAKTRGLSYVERERVVQEILQAFAASKDLFLNLWNHCQSS